MSLTSSRPGTSERVHCCWPAFFVGGRAWLGGMWHAAQCCGDRQLVGCLCRRGGAEQQATSLGSVYAQVLHCRWPPFAPHAGLAPTALRSGRRASLRPSSMAPSGEWLWVCSELAALAATGGRRPPLGPCACSRLRPAVRSAWGALWARCRCLGGWCCLMGGARYCRPHPPSPLWLCRAAGPQDAAAVQAVLRAGARSRV